MTKYLKRGPVIGITSGPGCCPDGKRPFLKEEYALAVLKAGGVPVAVPVSGSPREVLGFLDGIMVPGGDDIAPSYYGEKERVSMEVVSSRRTDFEIFLVRSAFHQNIPLLGICYGMQLINVALGGSLYQDLETDLGGSLPAAGPGREAVEHRRGPHEIIITGAGPLPAGRFMVNSSHHQGVSRPARALCPVARSEDGLVEALCSTELSFFAGVQWHPERMSGDPVAEKIFSSFIKAAGKQEDKTGKQGRL